MASSYSPKDSTQKAISMALGILLVLAVTAITYVIGWSIATSDGFKQSTKLVITYKMFGASYIAQAFGVLAGIIVYVIKFLLVGSKTYTNACFSKKTGNDGLPFVLKGWWIMAAVSCLATVACSTVIFVISFGEFRGDLVTCFLLYIWLIQGAATVLAYLFMPVKAN